VTEENQLYLKAYKEGKKAFLDGLRISDCPYDESDIYFRKTEWEHGFEDEFNKYAESFGGI